MKNTKNIQVAVISGSDRGIGFAVANLLGRSGYQIVICSPDKQKAGAAAQKLQNLGYPALSAKLDLLSEKDILELKDLVLRKFGKIDLLVNNAGVMLDSGRSKIEGILKTRIKKVPKKRDYGEGPGVLGVDLDIFRATLEVNTLGALRMCQVFVPLMLKAGQGRIINVSSSLGQLNDMTDEDRVPAYQLSKTALNAVTRLVADAAKPGNVAVNSVCPGWTRTDIGGQDAPQSVEQAAETVVWLAKQPLGGPTGSFFRNKRKIAW